MLREKERNEISVTDLCEVADIERSTLYANFGEISGLANSACEETDIISSLRLQIYHTAKQYIISQYDRWCSFYQNEIFGQDFSKAG